MDLPKAYTSNIFILCVTCEVKNNFIILLIHQSRSEEIGES